jgi:hypothetical protein
MYTLLRFSYKQIPYLNLFARRLGNFKTASVELFSQVDTFFVLSPEGVKLVSLGQRPIPIKLRKNELN